MRLPLIALLATAGCAETSWTPAEGGIDGVPDAPAGTEDVQPRDHVGVDDRIGGASPETVDLDGTASTDGSEALQGRPVAIAVVVEIGPALAGQDPALATAGLAVVDALSEALDPRDRVVVLGHHDRHAYALSPTRSVVAGQGREVLLAAIGGLTTCSTLADPVGWEALGYIHPVTHAPACFPDEAGSDPATAFVAARDVLALASNEAVHGVIWVGDGQTAALKVPEDRPEHWQDGHPSLVVHEGAWTAEELAAEAEAEALEHTWMLAVGDAPDQPWLDAVARGLGQAHVVDDPEAVRPPVTEAVRALLREAGR